MFQRLENNTKLRKLPVVICKTCVGGFGEFKAFHKCHHQQETRDEMSGD